MGTSFLESQIVWLGQMQTASDRVAEHRKLLRITDMYGNLGFMHYQQHLCSARL